MVSNAFIVMQIGDPDLDHVCESAIVPAIEQNGLSPKRVDKHNQGGLLKSEIVQFLTESTIIVADLTNERPNCYLEIGYAMGLNRFRHVILTVREDHMPDSTNYKKEGPKVHFDLIGYEILQWAANDLDGFREELSKRISRRMASIPNVQDGSVTAPPVIDHDWVDENREIALLSSTDTGVTGFLEVTAGIAWPKINRTQVELHSAATRAPLRLTGWPIGVVLNNVDDARPKAVGDAIVANVHTEDKMYDYWSVRRNGDFYFLGSFREDERDSSSLAFDLRILRVTEAFLYLARLYTGLQVDPTTSLELGFSHTGLKGRKLSSSNVQRRVGAHGPAIEDSCVTRVESSIDRIEVELVALVKQVLSELFVLFDFFQLDDVVYEEIVDGIVEGRTP